MTNPDNFLSLRAEKDQADWLSDLDITWDLDDVVDFWRFGDAFFISAYGNWRPDGYLFH